MFSIASKNKIFRSIILKLSYFFAILPGIGSLEPSLEINFFQEKYQIIKYQKILIPINQENVPETKYYPQIFHSIYPFFFQEEDSKLINLLKKNKELLYQNKNTLSEASLNDLFQSLDDSGDISKAKYWQLSEALLLSGQFFENNSLSTQFNHIFAQKDSIYKQFSLFISSYHDYLFKQTGKDFLYYFAANKYFKPAEPIHRKIKKLYQDYSQATDEKISYKKRMEILFKINYQLKPLFIEYLSIIKQVHRKNGLINKTNFIWKGQSFTEKTLKKAEQEISTNCYSSALKQVLLLRNYHQLILLQTILLLLILLFLFGFFLIMRSVKYKYYTLSACVALFMILVVFSFSSQNRIHQITEEIKNIENLTLFQINYQLEQKNSVMDEYCSMDFLTHSALNDKDRMNILILGKGGNSHVDSKSHRPLGINLTDALLILSVDFKEKTIHQLSIPRDLLYNHVKINSLYKFYGIDKTKHALFNITGVPIDKYVIIDFNFVRKFIDLIGGVSVHLEKDLKDFEWFSLSSGNHNLFGNNCLKYMRSRRTSSDFSRSRRQQQVISQLFKKLSLPEVKKELLTKKFFALYALYQEITTDIELNEAIHLSEKINNDFLFNSIVLSTYNCFNSEYDIDMGYIIYPKNNSWSSVKNYLKHKNFF